MNALALKIGLTTLLRRSGFFLKRHAPQIMVGLGVGGFVGTAVATGTAAVKARDILDAQECQLMDLDENEPDYKACKKKIKRETAVELAKTFAPPVTLGCASAALIFGGHHMMGRRAAAALASAYEAQTKLHDYRGRVVKQLGSAVDEKLMNGKAIDKEEIGRKLTEQGKEEKKNLEEGTTVITDPDNGDHPYMWLFASETCGYLHGCGIWRDDPEANRTALLRAQRSAQDMLHAKGYLLINDVLIDLFGADGTSYGATHGWFVDPRTGEIPQISFGLDNIAENPSVIRFLNGAESNVWLLFNCGEAPIVEQIDHIQDRRNYKRKIGTRTQRLANV